MNKQGQVFLLLTILSVTFLLAISTVLLDIQKSEYSEPSADSDKLFEAWDNSISSIEQIMSIQIAENINIGTNSISPHLNELESYLTSKGLISSIDLLSETYIPPNVLDTYANVSLNAEIFLYLSTSSGAHLDANLNLTITYSAVVDTSSNLLTVQKIVNNDHFYINDVIITSVGNVINNGNGSYQVDPANTYDILFTDNFVLQVQIP